jgi:hypothetical protein
MAENRIRELQDFALDFQEQLKEAKELYQQRKLNSKNLEPKYFKTENAKTKFNEEENKNKFKLGKNIEQLKLNDHWIPNCLFGKSFERFKKLTNGHFPTSWELVSKKNYFYNNFILIKYRQEFR